MAITRSQQAKQMLQNGGMLVKPGFGGTRQGYRGDAAARSSGARDSGRVGGSDVGEASTRSDPRDPGPDRSAVGAGSQFAKNRAREALKEQRRKAIEALSPSTKFSNRLISGALGALTPFGIGRFIFNKAIDQTAMGYGKTPSITDDEDDFENRDRGRDEPFIPNMLATPFQKDIIQKTVEELSPIELAIQQRDALSGPRAFAKEGGIMDLETGRQMYFLGKLVKKAKRAVKKIVKSPVGKTALAAAGIFKLGGGSFGELFR